MTTIVLLLLITLSAGAEQMAQSEPLKLKDGSYLFVNDDDTMRMVDKTGKPIQMKEGVEMELEDGSIVMMQNKRLWRHVHSKSKS